MEILSFTHIEKSSGIVVSFSVVSPKVVLYSSLQNNILN